MPEAVAIALFCTSCGAKLEITPDIERFVCLHCGTHHAVRRGGGIVSLQPLVEGISRVQQGTDRTAAELAIRRLSKEISEAGEELEKLENAPYDAIIPPPAGELALPAFVVCFAVLLFVVFAVFDMVQVGFVILCLLCFSILIRYANREEKRKARARLINEAEQEVVLTKIRKLQNALAQNRRIVSMQDVS